MADKRKTKKRKEEYGEPPESEKPTREEYSVAKWLKANVPTKKTKFLNHHVEYFTGVKAVDALLTSKWATGKSPIFTTRLEVTDYLHKMLLHKLFHRAKKVPVSEQELKGKSKKKDNNSKSGDEKDEKSQVSASEGKDTKDKDKENKEKEKKKRKIRLEMHMEQLFLDTMDAYVWIYDPMPWYYWVCGALVVFGTIGVCMFPLWPATVRKGVYYLSIAAAAFLVLIIALAVLRVVVFCLVWLLTLARHHLWLLPNLTEDVGFFASFWPLYKYEYRGPGSESDKSSKKKKRKKDKQSDDEEEKAPLLIQPPQDTPGEAAKGEAGDNKSYKRTLRGPCMTLVFTLRNRFPGPPVNEIGQGQFTIDDLVDIRLQFDQKTNENTIQSIASGSRVNTELRVPSFAPLPVFINISTKKTEKGKDLTVKLKVTCANLSKQLTCTDTWTEWIPLGQDECKYDDPFYALDNLELTFAVRKYGAVTFADLYDDTDMIDFKLTIEDGSIPVHKACLAAHSNKFKTMFTSIWKGVTDGRVDVKGVTPQTLTYLKDYMYLGKLPDYDVRPMLLFALHYSMQNLKADCITKLVETVDFYSLYSLLEFACANNIPELTFALMVQTSHEIVHNAYEMKKNPPLEEPQVD